MVLRVELGLVDALSSEVGRLEGLADVVAGVLEDEVGSEVEIGVEEGEDVD